jgi:hypothetical protein
MVKGQYTYFLASSQQKYFSGFISKTLTNFVVKVRTPRFDGGKIESKNDRQFFSA